MSRLLDAEPTVVTAGVALFEKALAAQAVPVVPVDWRPPHTQTPSKRTPTKN